RKSVCSALRSGSPAPRLSQNQAGLGGPYGLQRPAGGQFAAVRSGGSMKPEPCADAPGAVTDARAGHEMPEGVWTKPNSVTELPSSVGSPVAVTKSIWLPFRQ